MPGISTAELVFGVPHARIINAAFTHAARLGGRFNGPDRGAWYAGFEIEASQAEIAFHKTIYLAEAGFYYDVVTYVDNLADFSGPFHDLRTDTRFSPCLDPDSYVESEELAQELLKASSPGTLFSNVRHAGGTCLACFRPATVNNVRTGTHYEFAWNGEPEPTVKPVH